MKIGHGLFKFKLVYFLWRKSSSPALFFTLFHTCLRIHFHTTNEKMRIGYIRVSTQDQNPERQLIGINLEKKYVDIASGKDTSRPQFAIMMDYVREGDILYVDSMDRLARNLSDLKFVVKKLVDKGVHVHFVKQNMVFTGEDSPMSVLMLAVLGAFAEFERDIMRERQKEGIAIAKAAGKYRGSKPVLTPDQIREIKNCLLNGEPKARIARRYEITSRTLYNYIEQWEKK